MAPGVKGVRDLVGAVIPLRGGHVMAFDLAPIGLSRPCVLVFSTLAALALGKEALPEVADCDSLLRLSNPAKVFSAFHKVGLEIIVDLWGDDGGRCRYGLVERPMDTVAGRSRRPTRASRTRATARRNRRRRMA